MVDAAQQAGSGGTVSGPAPDCAVRLNLPEALHPVVRLLLQRPDLQDYLGQEQDAAKFAVMLQDVAADHAITVDDQVLRSALRPDPLGLGRFAPAPVEMAAWPGPGWVPGRSVPAGALPAFDWLWFGERKRTAPFFEDDVRRVSALPLNWLLRTRTGLDTLVAGAAVQATPPLAGLILHMSRCGSTLLSQMLGAIPAVAVTSEPEPLDAVLRWIAATAPEESLASAAIRAVAAALGRDSSGTVQQHVIKLEVWHSLFLAELRAALPGVSWTFVHRDPAEILVSQQAMPSIHILPGALDEGRVGLSGFDGGSVIEYAARVLGKCTQAAADGWSLGGGLALAYDQLRSSGASAAADHFSLALDEAGQRAMAAAGERDAKAPGQPFVDDTARKRAEVTPQLRAAADDAMAGPYAAIRGL